VPNLITSPEAEADLLEIWLYIAQDSPVNADRFMDKLEGKALKLCEYSGMGIDRPELSDGLKSFPVDSYLLYYRQTGTGIELVRVLHGSRDIDSLF
jgi:plasmid stabilization system protein ParE